MNELRGFDKVEVYLTWDWTLRRGGIAGTIRWKGSAWFFVLARLALLFSSVLYVRISRVCEREDNVSGGCRASL